jgi:mRNA interferase MazF
MARILRGEIYWADLDPTKGREQAGQRPVLILSQEIFNERSGTVIAMALTSQPQKGRISSHVRIIRSYAAKEIMDKG